DAMPSTDTGADASQSASSRTEERFAGWHCSEPGTFQELEPPGPPPKFSWMRPSILWSARNDTLARLLGDPTDDHRRAWVAAQRARGVPADFAIDRTDLGESFSCLIAGDTGEGTHPQFAVVPGLLEAGKGTGFLVVLSDVIYPIGDVNEYVDKFYRPYSRYPAPIYAVPGNHDWYDGLGGFMRHFCGAPELPPESRPRAFSEAWWRRLFWKNPHVPDEARLPHAQRPRHAPAPRAPPPRPHSALAAGPLRIVGIDPGILGGIAAGRGEWLRRVSRGDRPKILVTGKPIYVDDAYHPCPIAGGGTVDDIVRDPACNYVAAIGGDVH